MRTFKLRLALILSLVATILIVFINQNAERIDGRAAIATVNGVQNVTIAGNLTLAVLLIWGVLMLVLFAKSKGWIAVLPAIVILSACSGGATYATTNPRDVVFVVNLAESKDQTQVTSEVQGDQTDPKFWEINKQPVNIQRIPIPTTHKRTGPGIFGTDLGADFDPFPAVMVVTVPVTSVTKQWVAPAIVCDAPLPDMSTAFSMQSLEVNGGSTGVYTGASISAHISDPSLYLSAYGYDAKNETTNTHPARSLDQVLSEQVHGFIQQRLAHEYGTRSVVEQNRDMPVIFETIFGDLNTTFSKSGITITSFYDRDGNIYENCDIQKQFDQELARQNALQEANAAAALKEIEANSQVQNAYAQATATTVAAESAANAQALQAQVVNENPSSLQQQWINKWDGHLPQITGGDSTSYVPIVLDTPAPPSQ